jgi:hypothetical protein
LRNLFNKRVGEVNRFVGRKFLLPVLCVQGTLSLIRIIKQASRCS